MIYLDAAATTKPKDKVVDVINKYFEDWWNPSSLYSPSIKLRDKIEYAKTIVSEFINCKAEEIYFTSSGSESNCWAIQGFVKECLKYGDTPTVITSTIEHKSILSCVDDLLIDTHYVPVDNMGFIQLEALENIIKSLPSKNRFLVSIQYANNEIGTIQKIKDISEIVHKYGGVFHTDAVQAFGHIPIDVMVENIDMLSASGHKIGTPKGIGFLYIKDSIKISPIIYGTQMNHMRGGTENVPYIMGFAEAVKLCYKSKKNSLIVLRDNFIKKLIENFDCKINGDCYNRLPNNINITFNNNVTGESLIYMLDLCKIYLSAGSACNSHSNNPSHVLTAIGMNEEEATKTLRITIDDNFTDKDIDKVICEIYKQMRVLDDSLLDK